MTKNNNDETDYQPSYGVGKRAVVWVVISLLVLTLGAGAFGSIF